MLARSVVIAVTAGCGSAGSPVTDAAPDAPAWSWPPPAGTVLRLDEPTEVRLDCGASGPLPLWEVREDTLRTSGNPRGWGTVVRMTRQTATAASYQGPWTDPLTLLDYELTVALFAPESPGTVAAYIITLSSDAQRCTDTIIGQTTQLPDR